MGALKGGCLTAACTGLLAVEAIGSLLMWAPIPLAWIWVAARAYDATQSMAAFGAVALVGVGGTASLLVIALARVDGVWVSLRRRAGHEQEQGVLSSVVVASATLALAAFLVWFYVIGGAFVIPFMPTK